MQLTSAATCGGNATQTVSPQIIKYTKNWNWKDKDMQYIIFIPEKYPDFKL